MNVPSPTNPPQGHVDNLGYDGAALCDVTFSEESLCELEKWMDRELAALNQHFEAFVTVKSRKRSFGR
jgi:hypothetical protein